tara:strand:- start:460 stop:690 length:231 start_codon:yes stop_codon:yes gene_type:complete
MSCGTLRNDILDALRLEAQGIIDKARVNIEVYLHNPVGIGEHPDVIGAIQESLDVISEQEERIQALDKYFVNHSHK